MCRSSACACVGCCTDASMRFVPVRFTIASNQSLVLWALILAWNWRQVNFNDQDKKTHEVLYDRVTTLTKPTSSAMSAAGGSGPSATSSASSGAASTTSGPGSPAFAHLFHLILTQPVFPAIFSGTFSPIFFFGKPRAAAAGGLRRRRKFWGMLLSSDHFY